MGNKLSRRHFISKIFLTVFFLPLCSCVSVKIASEGPTKSKDILLTAPNNDFEKIKTEGSDVTWLNRKNGNSISYYSECNLANDISLQSIQNESFSALSDVNILNTQNVIYNDRDSLQTDADAAIDGVPIKISVVIFKKNGCNYTLTYAGRKEKFALNQTEFKKFVQDFRVN